MARSFTAVIRAGRGGGAYAEVPFDVEKAFGLARVPVKATIAGISFTTSLMRWGSPNHILPIPKAVREQAGKNHGDSARIAVELDTTPRVIEVPDDLIAVLKKNPAEKACFDQLSYTHRKEYVRWITEAKKPETRANRVAKTLAMLARKRDATKRVSATGNRESG